MGSLSGGPTDRRGRDERERGPKCYWKGKGRHLSSHAPRRKGGPIRGLPRVSRVEGLLQRRGTGVLSKGEGDWMVLPGWELQNLRIEGLGDEEVKD